FGGGATGGVALGGLGIGTKLAPVFGAGLVVTSVSHEPVTARATAERGATTKHATAQRETAVAGATSQRSLSRRSHTRATSSKRLSAPAHPHARRLRTRPTPVSSAANAVLGWVVWTATKRVAKQKAKPATGSGDSHVPNKSAVAAALAAVGGAVWFLRRRSGSGDES